MAAVAHFPPFHPCRYLPESGRSFSFRRQRMGVIDIDKLTIHDLDGAVLGFDLRDVLCALAPQSLAATWAIRSLGESDFEATGAGGLRLEGLADTQARTGGNELLAIADDTVQVIWGDFIGVLADNPQREWLIVRAFDSSFFEVETSDQAAVAAIKSSFRDVRSV